MGTEPIINLVHITYFRSLREGKHIKKGTLRSIRIWTFLVHYNTTLIEKEIQQNFRETNLVLNDKKGFRRFI